MPIFSSNIATPNRVVNPVVNLSVALAVMVGVLGAAGPASAFDPSKIFDGDVSSQKVFRFYFDARKNGQAADAVSVLKYAADKGNPAAQWKLGNMYETGDGVKRDPIAAFNIFKGITERYSRANPNSPDGQFASDAMVALGRYYRKGIPTGGVAPDKYQARVMFTTAAMVFRNANAQFELARMNLDKSDGMHDPKLAARMLTLSHSKGHNGAKALLGSMIFQGDHIRANPVEGLVMMEEAKKLATTQNFDWISELQEEAYAMATVKQRQAAAVQLGK